MPLAENEEFGPERSQPLGFEQQVAEVLVPATPAEEGFDVAVDGFHHA